MGFLGGHMWLLLVLVLLTICNSHASKYSKQKSTKIPNHLQPAYLRSERIFLPLYETMRGQGKEMLPNFTSIFKNMTSTHCSIRFVFGFSTGHVATTTFSSPLSYAPGNLSVSFVFERGGVPTQRYGANGSNWKIVHEVEHVEYYYGPEILSTTNCSNGKEQVVVDLSHSNLYFYKGLMEVLTKNNASFQFIRVHRPRHELALSMSQENGRPVDFFARDYFRYHPFENFQRVILKVPGGYHTWSSFSNFQRALWVIDETETRWRTFLQEYPSLNRLEVSWSRKESNILQAWQSIALAIGLNVSSELPQLKIHSAQAKQTESLLDTISNQDKKYWKAMKFSNQYSERYGRTKQRKTRQNPPHSRKKKFSLRSNQG